MDFYEFAKFIVPYHTLNSSLVSQAISEFDQLGFVTKAGTPYQTVMLSSNIIMLQFNVGAPITGRLDASLLSVLDENIALNRNYYDIMNLKLGDIGTRPDYGRVTWNNTYDTATTVEVNEKTAEMKQDVNGLTVIPARMANPERVPNAPEWTAVDKYVAVKWAQIIQDAAVAKDDEGNNLDLDLTRFRVSAVDSGFRTFISQEYYWHLKKVGEMTPVAAVPGRSAHGVGYAIDFCFGGSTMYTTMPANDREGQWIEANRTTYGVSGLGYDPYTRIYDEPWHWNFD